MTVDVELLVVPDCPNADAAARLLHIALAEAGLHGTQVRTTIIDSELAAEQRGFTGSPTFLLDGLDPFAEPGGQSALACRLYRAACGPAGLPSLPDLQAAVRRVAG